MNPDTGIQEKDYLRKRLEPALGDEDYIHLSDLLMALKEFATDESITILDYGCGGSPYRSLFPNSIYKRADFGEMKELDYVIGNDSRVVEKDGAFDLILSTQVAEHVSEPTVYFAECFRLLKSGGKLICTTHGTYPDHGCPYDFQRWTADGLARDLRNAGFEIERSLKLTTNARALMYLAQRFSGWFDSPSGISSWLFRIMRSVMHRRPAFFQGLADRAFGKNRVVTPDIDGYEFYLGLTVSAVKP
jgi:SAM-dependent methyltransferase